MAGLGNPPIPRAIGHDPSHPAAAGGRGSQPCPAAAALGDGPKQRPKGLITLVNRSSTTLYSGMVPGLIAGLYSRNQVAIDLRRLAAEAGVAFVKAEIQGLDVTGQTLWLEGRLPLPFTQLSLDVGAISQPLSPDQSLPTSGLVQIKPLEPALAFLERQDVNSTDPFHVVGSGLAGVEVALALRHRWPRRAIHLIAKANRLDSRLAKALSAAEVRVVHQSSDVERPLILQRSRLA